MMSEKENMKIVIVGHVDHGKSTLIGRLLYDTDSIPKEIIAGVQKVCEELGKKMEFAYFLDSLREEREENVTIDTTQIFFRTPKRNYVIIDAPGHVEFIKNMITGASQAEVAVLIVDAQEGIQEQTQRHAYILNLLGLKQVIVLINKMDLIDYDEEKFNSTKEELSRFLNKIGVRAEYVIPISAIKGDNIAKNSEKFTWYNGVTVLEALGSFKTVDKSVDKPLRFPVQDVYDIHGKNVIVGRIEAGRVKQGDEITFLPSNKKSRISSIEVWNDNRTEAEVGESVGVTVASPLQIGRGEIICSGSPPTVATKLQANIFWMSKNPVNTKEKLTMKCATQEVKCHVEKINYKIDSSTLEVIGKNCDKLLETEVGNVVLKTEKPLVTEDFNNVKELGRFVLVEDDIVMAGGIIL